MVLCIECLNDIKQQDDENNLFCSVYCSSCYYKNHCGYCNSIIIDDSIKQYPDVNSRAQVFCSYKCLNDFTENEICFHCDGEINKLLEKHNWIFYKNVFRIVCSSKCLEQIHLSCYYCLSKSSSISKTFLNKAMCDKCFLIIKRYEEVINSSYTNL
jgi:hypothetical protein